ncbi:hypothetical protein VIGAN_01263600, partial [Vigna angularis var. angularis]
LTNQPSFINIDITITLQTHIITTIPVNTFNHFFRLTTLFCKQAIFSFSTSLSSIFIKLPPTSLFLPLSSTVTTFPS